MSASHSDAIHVQISDGLGNQMFQFAAGLALALRNRSPLILEPVPYFFKLFNPPRHFGLKHFKLSSFVKVDLPRRRFLKRSLMSEKHQIPTFLEKNAYQFEEDFFKIQSPFRIQGFFQNTNYFSEISRPILLENFQIISKFSSKTKDLVRDLKKKNLATCVHLRLGDYKNSPIFKSLSSDYYQESIEVIRKSGIKEEDLWFFSNGSHREIEAVCQILKLKNPQIISGDEISDWEAMFVMTQFTHHIIANSTFSWWAAWLKKNSGLTIMPKQWFHEPSWRVDGLKVPGWMEI